MNESPWVHTAFDTREEWLNARTGWITASEVADMFDLGFNDAFTYWHFKKGNIPPPDLSQNEAVEWGQRLEETIARKYADATKRTVEHQGPFNFYVSTKYEPLAATPDAFVTHEDGRRGVLEIKNVGFHRRGEWMDGAPDAYRLQLQTQLAVLGLSWGSVAALIGGQRFVFFDYPRNDELINVIHRKAQTFLDEEPPPGRGESTAQALRTLYPDDTGDRVNLPDVAMDWHVRLGEIGIVIAKLESEKVTIQNRVLAALKDSTHGVDPLTGRVLFTYTTTHRKAFTVDAKSYRVLRRKVTK